MTALGTLPDVDLDALLAAELPPCRMSIVNVTTGARVWWCRAPAAVIAHVYAEQHSCDFHLRRVPLCQRHVDDIKAGDVWCCGVHRAPVRLEVTS